MSRPVALPLTITLALHAVIIALLVSGLSFHTEPKVLPPQPKVIQAQLISMEQMPAMRAKPKPVEAPPQPVAEPKPEPKPQPKPEPLKALPPELKKPEPIKPEPPEIPKPKPDLEKQKQIEKEKQVERDKAEALKKAEQQKQEAERKRKEQEQLEAQRKKQAEELARKQREQQERAELAKAMAAEDNAMAAERDQEAVASYIGMITRDIENSWSRPPNARLGMQVTLLIQLAYPSGGVMSVSIVKSSGNSAFDQSAVNAVNRVSKFPYLRDLKPQQFDQQFRRLMLNFNPTDLRQ